MTDRHYGDSFLCYVLTCIRVKHFDHSISVPYGEYIVVGLEAGDLKLFAGEIEDNLLGFDISEEDVLGFGTGINVLLDLGQSSLLGSDHAE